MKRLLTVTLGLCLFVVIGRGAVATAAEVARSAVSVSSACYACDCADPLSLYHRTIAFELDVAVLPTAPFLSVASGVVARSESRVVAAETGAATTEQVVVRGGADLAKITGQDQAAIQSAATRIGKPISLVGSRATGNISMASDYDYVVTGATKEEIAILRKTLPSAYTGLGQPPGIDIFSGGLQPGTPYVTFNP